MEQFKEIGSEFWDIDCAKNDNGLFPRDTKWFMSGRSALRFCIEDIKKRYYVKTVELPSWCCDSIIVPFIYAGIDVHFYPVIFAKGKLVVSPSYTYDITVLMDYFGYESSTDYSAHYSEKTIIVRDLTHSIFIKKYTDAEYYFGSIRKWSGIWTGGYAWSKYTWEGVQGVHQIHSEYIELRKQAMNEKAMYISGQQKQKRFLPLFACAEEILDSDLAIRTSSARDVHASRTLDKNKIKQKRRENAEYLLTHLDADFIFPAIQECDCPMFVPILTPDRQRFREYMINNGVYLPVHWPLSEYHILDEELRFFYDWSISLICDQRYGIQDMQRMLALIEQWRKRW